MNLIHRYTPCFLIPKRAVTLIDLHSRCVYAGWNQQNRCKTKTPETVIADYHAWCEFLRAEFQGRPPMLKPECERLTTAPDFGG
jgi:hypothetical protein